MGLRVFWIEGSSLLIGVDRFLGLFIFKNVSQRKPGSSMTFVHIGSGLERRGGTQKLLGIRLVSFCQHESEIQVGFEDVRLGSHGVSIGGNGLGSIPQRVVDESQVKPRLKVVWIGGHDLFKQRLSRGVVAFLDGSLGLRQFGREGRILVNNFVMTHGLAGALG